MAERKFQIHISAQAGEAVAGARETARELDALKPPPPLNPADFADFVKAQPPEEAT